MNDIRQQRTAEQIKIILSELCQRNLHDPRLQNLTITNVLIDRELQYANVYVSSLGDESRKKDVMTALKKATSFLRRQLAQQLHMRTVPQLIFHWDTTLAHAEKVNQILDELVIPVADPELPQTAVEEEE
jgi:ribosome-binding factor A